MTKKTSLGLERLLLVAVTVASFESVAMSQVAGPRAIRLDGATAVRPSITAGRSSRPAQPFVQPGQMQSEATHLIVESAAVSFGEVVADRPSEVADALMVRVFSDSDWELRLIPESAIAVAARAENPTMSRLEWKGPSSVRWAGFRPGESVVVSRGRQTGPAGQLVSVDLRLRLSDRDPVGQYGFNLRLVLETNR
ncbi:MAG TPA: hypothetical protein VMS12_02860 [Thermoanaerobaculia bacterium]|nr:hypothetical protein [Thermoanaerobaculia bacterium]